ncbi:hypothetical protein [Metapseudomonas otitidis]|uniref:hypothetical protein n=1 Tax=Metapseudomonas otitidis TaxID=319939 RepID=UPI000D19CC00|nr:hypothetical protein [Pseudomonas otitidis]
MDTELTIGSAPLWVVGCFLVTTLLAFTVHRRALGNVKLPVTLLFIVALALILGCLPGVEPAPHVIAVIVALATLVQTIFTVHLIGMIMGD